MALTCDVCDKYFARLDNLTRHMRSQAHIQKASVGGTTTKVDNDGDSLTSQDEQSQSDIDSEVEMLEPEDDVSGPEDEESDIEKDLQSYTNTTLVFSWVFL